jgi:hypothetical protein
VSAPEIPEETRRVLQHRAELFTQLAKTDAWQEMERELDRKAERLRKYQLALFAGTDPVDQRQIDHDRGFLTGLSYIKLVVAGAERALQKIDEQLHLTEPDEQEEDDLWAAPTT